MIVTLIDYTPDPVSVVANAATLCHFTESADPAKTVLLLLRKGHLSPFEHAVFRFGVTGVSRALSHQLVRHRIASFTQESQRVVQPVPYEAICPRTVLDAGAKAVELYMQAVNAAFVAMNELKKMGVPIEDARYILPNATSTRLLVTMNARSLLNFFDQRCCFRAQWEIRELAESMLERVNEVAPELFKKAGRSCEKRGICREGTPCGKAMVGVFIPG